MYQKIKNYYHLVQALMAAFYFNFPSKKLTVIGITGTDGKTTTATMVYHILKSTGENVSLITSVEAIIGGKHLETGLHVTTPSPFQIQKLLREAVNSGSKYFVLEATSHGLDQNRLAYVSFKAAGITNITPEHLDYHKTLENYTKAKAKLFNNVSFSVINRQDSSYPYLKNHVSGKITTYGLSEDADLNPANYPINLHIPGDYNLQNALCAAGICKSLGMGDTGIRKALSNFKLPKGRMQGINIGQKFKVFVDFAHTPNSLEQALSSLRPKLQKHGKLIAVFGAAGQRDKEKRPKMGQAAAKFADISIITSEDPRSENPKDIAKQIASGFGSKNPFLIVIDRKKAIAEAIKIAHNGDIVAFLGKGHEKSMAYGKKEYPWNEQAEVEKAIKRRANGE